MAIITAGFGFSWWQGPPVLIPVSVFVSAFILFRHVREMIELKQKKCTRVILFWLPVSAQHASQSPVSLTSDASSPRPYVSPRNGTPQTNQKSLLGVHPGSITSSQTRVSRTTISSKEKFSLVNGEALPLACDSSNLSPFPTFLQLASCSTSSLPSALLFRAICLQVNKDQSSCLRPQRSVQRTPGPSSREGKNRQKPLQHTIMLWW